MLHRRVQIAGFAPEADWSATQAEPNYAAPDLVAPVKLAGAGTLIWWGVGMNGNTERASPVSGAGASFDAQLVIKHAATDGRGTTYLGFTPISITHGSNLPFGRVAIERDLPPGATGWLRVISLTAAGTATHLWLSAQFIRAGAVGL